MEFGGWSLPPWPKSLIVIDFLARIAAFFTRLVDMVAGELVCSGALPYRRPRKATGERPRMEWNTREK